MKYLVQQWNYRKVNPSDIEPEFEDYSESTFDSLEEALKDYDRLVDECTNRYSDPDGAIVGGPIDSISYGPHSEGQYIRKTVLYWGDTEEYLLVIEN